MISVIENFLPDAKAERDRALSSNYSAVTHSGVTYQGIAPCDAPEWEGVKEKLGLSGGELTTFYRRYVAPELIKDDPKRWKLIHTDSEMGDWAGVLFLTPNEHCHGGLAFWRHKMTGFFMTPTLQNIEAIGQKNDDRFWENLRLDGEDPERWELLDYVPMAFNRLVLFPAHVFHSKWPAKGASEAFESARLIKAYFWRANVNG